MPAVAAAAAAQNDDKHYGQHDHKIAWPSANMPSYGGGKNSCAAESGEQQNIKKGPALGRDGQLREQSLQQKEQHQAKNPALRFAKRYRTEVAASMSSALSTAAAFPLDSVKTRMQTYKYSGFIDCVRHTYQTEKLRGFFRGVTAPMISITAVHVYKRQPVYQSEISPPHNRGKLACIEFTGNIFGYATSVWVDYFCGFITSNMSWRLPLMMQCIMGALLGLGSLIIVESPRWLLDNDHDEEGIVVIANLYGGGDIHNSKAREEFRDIKMDVLIQRQEGERSYSEMFKRYRTRVFIAMSAQALAQLNGINVISYYAPYVFESAGWVGHDAVLMTGINGITYLLSTVPPWYVVDSWGRRPILLSGAAMMTGSLAMISYFLYLDIKQTPMLVVIFVMIYNAAFGYSWGPIPWLYPPEILPLSIRSKGASLSTATNWAFNWLVGMMTPILQDIIHWRLYLVHAFFCASSFVIVYFIYPETCGVRLEDMGSLFGDSTTAMGTPATMGTPAQDPETGALLRPGSPIPPLDIRNGSGGPFGAAGAIPGLNIDPPDQAAVDAKNSRDAEEGGGGIGAWLSRLLGRGRSRDGESSRDGGRYTAIGQGDD